MTSRAVKGPQVMAVKNEQLAVIYAIPESQDKLFISSNNKAILLDVNSIPVQNRSTIGVRIINTKDKEALIEIM